MLAQRELLDQLMGKDRNVGADKRKSRDQDWRDADVCQYYIAGFCPHDLFTNTKSDIGPCENLHDDALYEKFQQEPPDVQARVLHNFLRYLCKLCDDVDRRIRRGASRLSQQVKIDQTDPNFKIREQRILQLNDTISELIVKMEKLGDEGLVDESHTLMQQVDALNAEKAELQEQQEAGQRYIDSHEKQMEVCEICGAFLTNSETEVRIQSHMNGKQHVGFSRIRETIQELRTKLNAMGPAAAPAPPRGERRRPRSSRSRSPQRGVHPRRGGGAYRDAAYRDRGRDRDRDRDRDGRAREGDKPRDQRGDRGCRY